jgi:hypothetical protein
LIFSVGENPFLIDGIVTGSFRWIMTVKNLLDLMFKVSGMILIMK